ncbi:hypothetical protein GGD63_006285 [Bradyrhizobium sp. cir1]|nr:hypothetical protein [Bradyrhizobium sp. cir1]
MRLHVRTGGTTPIPRCKPANPVMVYFSCKDALRSCRPI